MFLMFFIPFKITMVVYFTTFQNCARFSQSMLIRIIRNLRYLLFERLKPLQCTLREEIFADTLISKFRRNLMQKN